MWIHADPKKPAALLWLETTHCTSEPDATSLYFWLLCLFSLADLVWTLETKDKRLSSCTDMGAHRIRFVHTSIFLLFIISWASQLHQRCLFGFFYFGVSYQAQRTQCKSGSKPFLLWTLWHHQWSIFSMELSWDGIQLNLFCEASNTNSNHAL